MEQLSVEKMMEYNDRCDDVLKIVERYYLQESGSETLTTIHVLLLRLMLDLNTICQLMIMAGVCTQEQYLFLKAEKYEENLALRNENKHWKEAIKEQEQKSNDN